MNGRSRLNFWLAGSVGLPPLLYNRVLRFSLGQDYGNFSYHKSLCSCLLLEPLLLPLSLLQNAIGFLHLLFQNHRFRIILGGRGYGKSEIP